VKRFSLILSFIAVAGLSHADLRAEIMAARNKQEKAAKAKDVNGAKAALKSFMTPDFTFVQDGKVQDAKTFIENFTASLVMMDKITSSTTRIVSLKESGKTGSGKVELHMTGTMKGSDKKIHSMNWTGLFTEEYRKVGGKWKAAKMTAGPQKFLMDGKPAKM
jgi:ketosteroid isomerase-like protein